MSNNVRFSIGIPCSAEKAKKDGTPSWSLETHIVPLDRECVWFVECYPVFHPVSKILETSFRVICKVLSTKKQKLKIIGYFIDDAILYHLSIKKI